jgi:hypothetical protein
MTKHYHETAAQQNAPEGLNEWLDYVDAALPPSLPPRESLINRLAWAVTFHYANFIRRQDDGSYLVPSRSQRGKEYRVTEKDGCECPDWQHRGICGHWLSIGSPSNAAFLVARIHRARSLGQLEAVRRDYQRCQNPAYRNMPADLLRFAIAEYHRARKYFAPDLYPAKAKAAVGDPFANFD